MLLISSENGKQLVFLAVSGETQYDMKTITDWMKTQGIKGGGTLKHFQGTADKLPTEFVKLFTNFINA